MVRGRKSRNRSNKRWEGRWISIRGRLKTRTKEGGKEDKHAESPIYSSKTITEI